MGKRIIKQRRGRGKPRYATPRHRFHGPVRHHPISDTHHVGIVKELLHSVAHSAPVAQVSFDDKTVVRMFAHEGMVVGAQVSVGSSGDVKDGNTLSLEHIPEGTLIHNIEGLPGDGGKFVRSSGTSARVVAKTEDGITVVMPSRKKKIFLKGCRATIGIVAGGGRLEKPLAKAGKQWHAKRARGKLFPVTSKVAMNANDHPFGCGRGRHVGKPKTPNRNAPPGRKVGMIGARRTGRKTR